MKHGHFVIQRVGLEEPAFQRSGLESRHRGSSRYRQDMILPIPWTLGVSDERDGTQIYGIYTWLFYGSQSLMDVGFSMGNNQIKGPLL